MTDTTSTTTTKEVGRQVLNKKDCPIDFVTVFNDRAEVTRRVAAKLDKGSHELVITDLPATVDANSFRVSGGVGKATILEVSYEVLYDKPVDVEADKHEKEIQDAQDARDEIQHAIARLNKEEQWLEGWSSSVMQAPKAPKEKSDAGASVDLLSNNTLTGVEQFLGFYHKQLQRLDQGRAELKLKLKDAQDKANLLAKKYAITHPAERRQVTIILDAHADVEVKLQVSYVIMQAMWQAAYDIRVNSDEKTLQLVYYGTITNNTSDDWLDANLALSTATPSIGGSPPGLTTATVNWAGFGDPSPASQHTVGHAWNINRNVYRAERQQLRSADIASNVGGDLMLGEMEQEQSVAVLTAKAEDGVTSTSFSIPRSATILSDNKPHKVTVGIFDFKPRFTYTVIPKKSNFAYLKATTQNSTKFPLLAGDINVFMDNNFVARSNLRYVGRGENFATFLGIDGGIRVEYKPEKKSTETGGFVNKTSTQTYKYETVIKNNKATDIFVQVVDQLPLSSDEKIKVKLIEPVIKEAPVAPGEDIPVKLNDKNNVEWRLTIPAGKDANIPFSYTVDAPSGRPVQIYS